MKPQYSNYYGSLVYGAITLVYLMYFGTTTDNHLVVSVVLWASACCWASAWLGTSEDDWPLFAGGLLAIVSIALIVFALVQVAI